MRWSQMVRLNLANDNRKLAVNSLVLATDDTINISNIATYTVADFKKVLDFGKNVLVGDILDSSTLSIKSLIIGDTELTSDSIKNIVSINLSNLVILNYISLNNDDSDESLAINTNVDITGQLRSSTLVTDLLQVGDFTEIYNDKITFRDTDVSGTYSSMSYDGIEIKDMSGDCVYIKQDGIIIENEYNKTSVRSDEIIIQSNDIPVLSLRGNPNEDESHLEISDNIGNSINISPESFTCDASGNNMEWKNGNLNFSNSNNLNTTKIKTNDSDETCIEISNENETNSVKINPTSVIIQNQNDMCNISVSGEIVLSNNTNSNSLIINNNSIELNDDLSGNFLIESNFFKVSNGSEMMEWNNGELLLHNDDNTISLSPSDLSGNIKISNNDSSTIISYDRLSVSGPDRGVSITEDGISYNGNTTTIENVNSTTINLDFEINNFGPEIKLYVSSYNFEFSFVMLINL